MPLRVVARDRIMARHKAVEEQCVRQEAKEPMLPRDKEGFARPHALHVIHKPLHVLHVYVVIDRKSECRSKRQKRFERTQRLLLHHAAVRRAI